MNAVVAMLRLITLVGAAWMAPVAHAQAPTGVDEAAHAALKAEVAALGRGPSPQKAVLLERGCNEFADGRMCVERARYAADSDPSRPDHAQAFVWYDKGCELKSYDGCRGAASTFIARRDRDNLGKAAAYYQKACDISGESPCRLAVGIQEVIREAAAKRASPTATAGSNGMPPPTASYAEHQSALGRMSALTSLASPGCNLLIRRLKSDQGRSEGSLGQAWWQTLGAASRNNNNACSTVPVPMARKIEAELAAAAPRPAPKPLPEDNPYASKPCDSTCQRQQNILDLRPLSCYVSNGQRICNK